MLRNYFKIAWRNLQKKPSYSFMNIAGLGIGIAVCMIIFFVIQYNTSFDGFHFGKDRIFRVITQYHKEDAVTSATSKDVPFPLPRALKSTFPQLPQVTAVFASQNDQILLSDEKGNFTKTFKENKGVFFTDAAFFKIFDFPLLDGSYESMDEPNTVLLTKETAERYFGTWQAAMGKTIHLEAGGSIFSHSTDVLKVTGILNTIPQNTDFQLKVVASVSSETSAYMLRSTDWDDHTNSNFGCFVSLPPDLSEIDFNSQLALFASKVKSPQNKDTFLAQPLSEVHFDVESGNYGGKTVSQELLNVLWLIAALILLIACVNFVNLSTAQAVNRAKDVGVRKAVGSSKAQLQVQFMTETFLIVISSVIIATAIGFMSLPFVNRLLEISLNFTILTDTSVLVFLLTVTVLVTVLAGFYPALVMSGFSPVNALKSKFSVNSASGLSLRRGLVIFQFMIAQALIIGTFIILKQMNYFMDRPIGFDKEEIIHVPFRLDSLRISRLEFLRNELTAINGVESVSFSTNTPIENEENMWNNFRFDNAEKDSDVKAITKFADSHFISTYKLNLVAGRNLKPTGMTQEFLVNESLMRSLGITNPEEILGKEISIWNGVIKCPVVGILKDFNNQSFHHNLAPMIVSSNNTMYSMAGIKLQSAGIAATLASVKSTFDKTFPNFVYEYHFLDDKIDAFYKEEVQLAQLYKLFAGIAIFLSCMGLYGLATFMTAQRIKEVGVRKVMGASVSQIVGLLSKEFIKMVLFAIIIASPVAWYLMSRWLQDFTYRIDISWWIFAISGTLAIGMAFLTVSFETIKAARVNPVKSLRSE